MEKQPAFGLFPACDLADGFGCLVSSVRKEHQQITHLADILPPTAHCGVSERWDRNDSILSRYWTAHDGIDNSILEEDRSQPHHLTYGEVTPLGVRQLAYEMDIARCDDDENDSVDVTNDMRNETNGIVFYDLGSGVGRLVTQMYMDQPDLVSKAIGIELAEDRHAIGTRALEGITLDGGVGSFRPNDDNDKFFPIELIHGDATQVDLDASTTHVFLSSLCFPETVLRTIQEKLLDLPNIRVIAALNRLDKLGDEWHERTVPIQMSWGASSAKLYHKV